MIFGEPLSNELMPFSQESPSNSLIQYVDCLLLAAKTREVCPQEQIKYWAYSKTKDIKCLEEMPRLCKVSQVLQIHT